MYCKKCGSQITEGSKFCGSCGAMQQVEQQAMEHGATQYSHGQPEVSSQPAVKEKKKSKGSKIAITCVIVLCAWIIGRIAGGSMADSYNNDKQSNNDSEITFNNTYNNSESKDANPKYKEIFTSHYIVESPSFILGMDSSCFAAEIDNGCIEKIEFGYKDDIVLKMINTIYVPIENYSSIEEIRNIYHEVEQAECCAVEFETGNLFYTVTITCEDMDDAGNLAELYQLGMVSTATGSVSMKESEAGLLKNGYVKR